MYDLNVAAEFCLPRLLLWQPAMFYFLAATTVVVAAALVVCKGRMPMRALLGAAPCQSQAVQCLSSGCLDPLGGA